MGCRSHRRVSDKQLGVSSRKGTLSTIAYWILLGTFAGIPPSKGDNAHGPDPRGGSMMRTTLNIDPVVETSSSAERAMDRLIESQGGARKSFGLR